MLENSGQNHQQIVGFDMENLTENLTKCDDNTVEKCKQLCGQQVFKNTFYKLIKINFLRLVKTIILIWKEKQ
jgi:hypothetical protein